MATEADPTLTATLLAVALGLVKVIEVLVSWVFKKMAKTSEEKIVHPENLVVHLSPEASQMIREMHATVTKTDELSVPLVYGPRHEMQQLAAAMEAVEEKVEETNSTSEAVLNLLAKKQ